MITLTTALRNDDGPEALVRSAARWQAYKRRLSARAEALEYAPSQILSMVGEWRRMEVGAK